MRVVQRTLVFSHPNEKLPTFSGKWVADDVYEAVQIL